MADCKEQIAIIGGGLVGSLNACFLAKRGYNVELYEYRPDIRQTQQVRGRSINLALSVRGLSALDAVGIAEQVLDHGIPMYARMIHELNGKRHAIPYGTDDQCIYSVGRRFLNEIILNEAESYTNVSLHFETKVVNANLHRGEITLRRGETLDTVRADLIVGCDGAFSTIRGQMLRENGFNFTQRFIEHGYLELSIPPTTDGDFAMEKNYLHIWPRGTFMMIALPNQDHSFTVTLFMPFEKFEALDNAETLLAFFKQTFPDSLAFISETQLINDFFTLKPSYLLTVKCNPYHVADKAIIMGDAAHAMVPFYGQGMNAGFEDCLIFDQLMSNFNNDLGQVLSQFSIQRNPDAEAICDLALHNYLVMRHLVTTKAFFFRKYVDNFLHRWLKDKWMPLYTMVTFSRTPYHLCIKHQKWQNKVLSRVKIGLASSMVVLAAVALHWWPWTNSLLTDKAKGKS